MLDFHAYFGDANMTDNPLIFFFKAIYYESIKFTQKLANQSTY